MDAEKHSCDGKCSEKLIRYSLVMERDSVNRDKFSDLMAKHHMDAGVNIVRIWNKTQEGEDIRPLAREFIADRLEFVDPLQVYLPKRNAKVNMANPGASFNRDYLYSPGVVFVVNQQEYDGKYILTSLDFLRQLLDYTTEVSAMELKLKPNVNTSSVQSKIENILGDDFVVQNRYQQQADVFRIMEIEKLISYLFLTFILMIACFNVIGSLSMLILDKKDDVVTLRSLGASDKLISRIFLFEGRLISLFGAISGIALGLILCFIQQKFGIISLGGGGGTFVVDAYPVSVHAWDVVLIFITVLAVGFLSVWYPVRYLSKRLL